MGGMLMDYMKEIKEISAEQAIILWQASRLSLSKIYEKAPEILKVQGSRGTLPGLKLQRNVVETLQPSGRCEGAAWLSSARAVRCRLKCHNERNPYL